MIDIYLTVEGQSLAVRSKPERIVAGSKGMMRLHFGFDSEWEGFRAVADFGDDATPICDDVCMVPDGCTDGPVVKFRVIGERDGSRLVTDRVVLRQEVD